MELKTEEKVVLAYPSVMYKKGALPDIRTKG